MCFILVSFLLSFPVSIRWERDTEKKPTKIEVQRQNSTVIDVYFHEWKECMSRILIAVFSGHISTSDEVVLLQKWKPTKTWR